MNETRFSLLDEIRRTTSSERWHEFFDEYAVLLTRWLRSSGVDSNDADDLVSEVMLTVTEQIKTFEHNGRTGAFRAWLRGILHRRLQRAFQQKSRMRGVEQIASVAEELADPSSELSRSWDRQHDEYLIRYLLRYVKDHLSPESADIFDRLTVGGESIQQVAQRHKMNEGAIRVRQFRALRQVREFAGGLLDEIPGASEIG